MLSLIVAALSVPAADDIAPLHPPSAAAQSTGKPMHSSTFWRAGVAALAATNAMDVQSSWGKRELNPALAGPGGALGARGALLKAAIAGGVVAMEYLALRHSPSVRLRRALAVIDFGDAALIGAVAGRNWGVPAH